MPSSRDAKHSGDTRLEKGRGDYGGFPIIVDSAAATATAADARGVGILVGNECGGVVVVLSLLLLLYADTRR